MQAGLQPGPEAHTVPDRGQAIVECLLKAQPQDVVLLAGKGHESTQEIKGHFWPFSDEAWARQALALRMQVPMMSLHELVKNLPGAVLQGQGQGRFYRVHTDTRSLQPGDLFVALQGSRFDGHEFLPDAVRSGAVAAVVQLGRLPELEAAGLPGVGVPDTLLALGQLATAWRASFQIPVVGVTGSNGKTTVTQMVFSMLKAQWGGAAWATRGNFNNEIGVPLTLLGLRKGGAQPHQAAVVEMGMNHPGEIEKLAQMVQPTVAVVNNAQREHQEFMNGIEAVALENGSVLKALGPQGVAVYPEDDACTPLWNGLATQVRVLRFGLNPQAQVWAQAQWQPASETRETGAWSGTLHLPQSEVAFELAMAGQHNLRNALAAAASAWAAGCSEAAITQGLGDFKPVKGRSQTLVLDTPAGRITLVDDSYNANPDSVRAAVSVLAGLAGPHWLILGDMGEVGEQGPAFHAEVGDWAAENGLQTLWAVGELAWHTAQAYAGKARQMGLHPWQVQHWASTHEALQALQQQARWPNCTSVLVKGSRFMGMEKVVKALQERQEAWHAA
jgi:murE/murF fusion protein